MEIPTSSDLLTYSDSKCKICLRNGHGSHFGVDSCRACAAFFRRTVVLSRKYKCKARNGKCEIDLSTAEKLMCRYCRFKKCVDTGMTTENVRTDQLVKSESKELAVVPPDPTYYADRVEYPIVNPETKKPATLIDVQAIIKRSRIILETFYPPDDDEFLQLNPLQKMVFSLEKIRRTQSFNPEFFEHIQFHKLFNMWEKNMTETSEWLMHCDEFRNLPPHERIAIFKIVWAVWRRFERYTMTAEIFGQQCYDEKILLHSHECAARFGTYSIDYSTVSNNSHEKFNNIFGGKMIQYYDIIVKPYLELKLSITEVTYILCQIVWCYAGRRLQGQTQAAGERFCEQIADNLHEYYKSQGEMDNYAPRIVKMMHIVNSMLAIQLKRESTMDMAILFDLFNVVFTEPEFFRV